MVDCRRSRGDLRSARDPLRASDRVRAELCHHAANRDFGEKLLGAKDFQEAFRIQAEYFQSRLKACAEDAAQIGAKMAGSFKQTG